MDITKITQNVCLFYGYVENATLKFTEEEKMKEETKLFLDKIINDGKHNRNYTTRDDMMDLYEAVEREGKWDKLQDHLHLKFRRSIFFPTDITEPSIKLGDSFGAWLFCLNKQGYEARCLMVAEFYGYKENDRS